MGSGTNAILTCGSQMDAFTPTKRCSPLRVHLSNQPTPKRCYVLGQALHQAVESWPSDKRVAVIASGGLSHFVIDEELDHQIITAMQNSDAAALTTIPRSV
jgi:aromatic ring-opening dioxygenase catalytic subunit (LigB family)